MRGVYTALVSPFNSSGRLDLEAFKNHLLKQKAAQVSGVIPCGTTGESPTLRIEEKKELISLTLEVLKGSRVKVFAGTGTNNTEETVTLSKWAFEQGVAGLLVVTPYYNKPNPSGMLAHFKAVSDAVGCEIMLYHVPSRTGSMMSVESILEVVKLPKVQSIKEASGSISFACDLIDGLLTFKKESGKTIDVFSGDDASFLPHLAVGAVGVVSVASNLIPKQLVEIQTYFENQDLIKAQHVHQKYYPIFRDLFLETNPVPIKFAISLLGQADPTVRLPLGPMAKNKADLLIKSLKQCGIIP